MNKKTHSVMMLTLLLMGLLALAFEIEPANTEPSDPPAMEWSQTYGGADWDVACSVVETGDGGYALAGYTYSFGAGGCDCWLVKTDSAGNAEWNQTYGGTDSDWFNSVVETGDGGYALAGLTWSFGAGDTDFWLVKTDATGNVEWNQTYGGTSNDCAYSIVETGDGGYALAGYTYSFGAGGQDFWLVKTDAEGQMEWNQTYGGPYYDRTYSVVETGDGGYALAGWTQSFGAGDTDFWLVKTDATGNVEWNQTYGGTSGDEAWSVVETVDGGYVLAGYTWSFGAGNNDLWLVKTDAAGNMLWNQTYGGTGKDVALCVVETGDGGYALAGETQSFGAGFGDCWLVKTDSSGNMEWNQTYGGPSRDGALSVVETGDGGYALAGRTASYGAGDYDCWLVKLAGLAPQIVEATVDLTPKAMNLKSNGKWVTCYLELPQDYNVENIALDAIRVNDAVGIDADAPTEIGDYDADGVLDLMVKFDRHDVIALLSVGDATLTITGEVNGTPFEGNDIIRVIGE